jgi:hypothetical protein
MIFLLALGSFRFMVSVSCFMTIFYIKRDKNLKMKIVSDGFKDRKCSNVQSAISNIQYQNAGCQNQLQEKHFWILIID